MKLVVGALLSAVALAAASNVSAGVYTDDLAKCMVSKSTDADKINLVRWIFASLAANPNVTDLSAATPSVRDELHRKTGQLYGRLVLEECRTEAIAAVRYEGVGALEGSSQVLGEVAARNLMGEPTTAAELQNLGKHLDLEKWEAFGREVGIAASKQ
jgi:hypothetical protein